MKITILQLAKIEIGKLIIIVQMLKKYLIVIKRHIIRYQLHMAKGFKSHRPLIYFFPIVKKDKENFLPWPNK